MSAQLPTFPWPYARPGSSFHRSPGEMADELWREFNESCDCPIWWNSGRGSYVVRLLDHLAQGLG